MSASTSTTDRTAGEIDWPDWAERTPPRSRTRTPKYSVTMHQSIEHIETELMDRVGADDWRLSTAAPHRKSDGLPYADSNPDDPAVVVRWTKAGDQYCVACDEYTTVRDNARTIGLYIEEKRRMSDRPVKTGQDEFATARLPPGDDEEAIVATGRVQREPHEVLGVPEDAPDHVIRGAFRELARNGHPDAGGDLDMGEIRRAKEAMLDE